MRKSILNGSQIMNFAFQIERAEGTHFHQSIEIFYVLEGNCEVVVQDRIYQAHPEDLIVINANKKHSYQSKEDVLIGYVEIDFHLLEELLGTNRLFFWCNSVLDRNAAYDDMRAILKNIFSQYFEKGGFGEVVLQSLYYRLLQVLVENFMVKNDDQRFAGQNSPDENRLSEIINYIHSNYQRKISLSELSGALYLSVPYLSKYIKRQMGMNFIDYVNNIRLFHAVDDLLYTNNSITMIALENGFANAASFTKRLKDAYGLTPSEYRQKMKVHPEKEGKKQKSNRSVLEKKISDYLDNQVVQEPLDVNSHDSYIILDARNKEEYDPYWKRMLNIGRLEDLLRSDMREQVLMFSRDLGFSYVRIWDFFSEGMLLDHIGTSGEYYFNRVDSVFDFLTSHGIHIYLELGFKPKRLHSTLNDDIVWERHDPPFADHREADRFLDTLITHFINRYGLEEVETWYFELWAGEDFDKGGYDEDYMASFRKLYQAVRRHSQKIRIGGGGIGIQYGSENMKKLVGEWEKSQCRPDFFSLYCYPYIRGDEGGASYIRQSSDRDFLKSQLEMAENVIRDSGLKDTEIHVSEWSSTISNRNLLNDSCYKGAYILKGIMDCFGKANVLGYWVGSDIFSEHMDTSRLLFGGCGLVSVCGIKKPAFYAYWFLNHCGKYLLYKGSSSLVTTNGNNNYSIVCHNYRHLNYKYFLKKENQLNEEKLYQLYEDSQALQLNYQLTNVKNGKYKIKTYSVSEEQGSIQKEWQRLGKIESLSNAEIEYLKQICTPHIQIRVCEVSGNVLNFETRMLPQEIQYIHISYLYE